MIIERADVMQNRHLIRPADTDGRFALVEHVLEPHELAAPVHTHEREDEYSYVIEGRLGALVGGDETEAGPGELVAKPRGVPHAFWNASGERTRILELISPGEFANYFDEIEPLLTVQGPPDLAALAELQARYALTMDFATIGPLSERHHLAMPGAA
jgi:mannose-6-phosphate isomerase-like protein (cupin superfamily)